MTKKKYIVNLSSSTMSSTKVKVLIASVIVIVILLLSYGCYYVSQLSTAPPIDGSTSGLAVLDDNLQFRRQFVKNMAIEAWRYYVKHAWGREAVKAVSNQTEIEQEGLPGQTILASMSTLWVMELEEEFAKAKNWVAEQKFDFRQNHKLLKVYDIVSGYLGALLSCYALDGDKMFIEKANEVAKFLKPAYQFDDNENVIAYRSIDPQTQSAQYKPLSTEIFAQYLPYLYLSNVTFTKSYSDLIVAFQDTFQSMSLNIFLPPVAVNFEAQIWDSTLWPEDSREKENLLYSSLVNVYLQSNGSSEVIIRSFEKVIDSVVEKQVKEWKPNSVYLQSFFDDAQIPLLSMNLYQCNIGAILALGSKALKRDLDDSDSVDSETKASATERYMEYFKVGELLIDTCHLAANSSKSRLPPERFFFENGSLIGKSEGFKLSSQLAESYFYLYRLTENEKYRTYAWELTLALHHWTRTSDGAYFPIRNVNESPTEAEPGAFMPPAFFSATLKYLYLINSDKLPLDSWVFTEIGHPLPVIGENQWDVGGEKGDNRKKVVIAESPVAN